MTNITLSRPDGNEARDTVEVSSAHPRLDIGFDLPVKKPPVPVAPPAPVKPQPPQPPIPQPEELNDFANPNKIEDSPELDLESPGMDGMDDPYAEDYEEDFRDNYQQQQPPQVQPLPPFETLEDERADLMYKLQRAARAGIQVRTFGWNADIREIRAEAGRVKAEQEVDASIAFQRQILMTICTGLEFANKRFAYLDLELDGWSENMMDDIGKFDTVFEKLHKKHAGRMNIPPELQLVFMIGGSALTWHLVAKSRKSRTIDEEKERKRRKKSRKRDRYADDSDSDSDESERSRLRRKYSRPKKQPQQQKEMKGPGVDVGQMMGGLPGMMMPPVPMPDIMPMLTRAMPPPAPKKPPVVEEVPESPQVSEELSPEDDESERLSDIPSEALDDVPSEFGNSPQFVDERVIDIQQKEPPKRGRPKKNATSNKKVIVI